MSSREPRLTVVMVADECRDRVQRALDCLCAQTARLDGDCRPARR